MTKQRNCFPSELSIMKKTINVSLSKGKKSQTLYNY